MDPALSRGKSTRYLFSNRDLTSYRNDSLALLGRFGSVNAYELLDWRPRLETAGTCDRKGLRWRCYPPARIPRKRTRPETPRLARKAFPDMEVCASRNPGTGNSKSRSVAAGDTLIVRERFSPEWRYRVDGGAWLKPLQTEEHFTALPLGAGPIVGYVLLAYGFYQAGCSAWFSRRACWGFPVAEKVLKPAARLLLFLWPSCLAAYRFGGVAFYWLPSRPSSRPWKYPRPYPWPNPI